MRFDAAIDEFARAVCDPSQPTPAQTLGREGGPDAQRFAVYRNNVAVGLVNALAARFPVTQRLVGEDFFRAMARVYVQQEKPRSAILIHYGPGLADFIASFEPARELPYLPDVARLESAWVDAYHAAEGPRLTLAALATLDPETLPDLRFGFHPAARLLRAAHPAASIWAGHQGEGDPRTPALWAPEDALVTRPDADVFVRVLPPGGYDFAAALMRGATLGEALESVLIENFDPGHHLVGLIEAGALADFNPGTTP